MLSLDPKTKPDLAANAMRGNTPPAPGPGNAIASFLAQAAATPVRRPTVQELSARATPPAPEPETGPAAAPVAARMLFLRRDRDKGWYATFLGFPSNIQGSNLPLACPIKAKLGEALEHLKARHGAETFIGAWIMVAPC